MNPTAEHTVQRIQTALEKGESAAVVGVIKLIQNLAEKSFDISTSELAELISSDVAVTQKIIETANTLAYNTSGRRITTVTQSINLIGFSAVRNLAMSLLLIKNSEDQMNVSEQREVSAFALCSGMMAQMVIEEQAPDLSEQSFICTTLRNYGKLLMSTFLVDDYRQAQAHALKHGEDKAFSSVFGLTPLELSYILLESAHMPDIIMSCLREVPLHIIRRAAKSEVEQISIAADFSSKICDMALFSDLQPEDLGAALEVLLEQYEEHVMLNQDAALKLLKRVGEQIQSFCSDHHLSLIPETLARRIAARVNKQRPPPAEPEGEPAPEVPVGPAPMGRAVAKLEKILADPPLVPARAYMIALEAMMEDQHLDDCILFRRRTGSDEFVQATGCGKLYYATRARAAVKATDHNVMGLSINRKKDVIFASTIGERIQELLPGWIKGFKEPRALYVLPVYAQGSCEGLILGVSWSGFLQEIQGERLAELRTLRSLVGEVVDYVISHGAPECG